MPPASVYLHSCAIKVSLSCAATTSYRGRPLLISRADGTYLHNKSADWTSPSGDMTGEVATGERGLEGLLGALRRRRGGPGGGLLKSRQTLHRRRPSVRPSVRASVISGHWRAVSVGRRVTGCHSSSVTRLSSGHGSAARSPPLRRSLSSREYVQERRHIASLSGCDRLEGCQLSRVTVAGVSGALHRMGT